MWIKRQKWDTQETHLLRKGELSLSSARPRRRGCASEHRGTVSGCEAARFMGLRRAARRVGIGCGSGRLERSQTWGNASGNVRVSGFSDPLSANLLLRIDS